MENRQRRLIAAGVLAISLVVGAYLVFFSPSETRIRLATPTVTDSETPQDSMVGGLPWTQPPSATGSFETHTAEAVSIDRQTSRESNDQNSGDERSREMAPMPDWLGRIASQPEHAQCPASPTRKATVSTADELTSALANATAGDVITLLPGTYLGNFTIERSGTSAQRIWICGPRDAIIDSGGPRNGYGLHITGSYVGVWGVTVANAQKGIVIDSGDFVQIDNVEVRSIGDEAIHFRKNATDGVVQDCLIHHTGLRRDKFGEGIYVGSAVSNWEKISEGKPDQSDRVRISRNRIWDTTAESIDIKEGTNGGTIEYNSFDGVGMTGADSWVDLKGNEYLVIGNTGVNAPKDGFQTHNIDNMGSGSDNQFRSNSAQVNGPGYGFYIHDPDTTGNSISCTNIVTKAASGFSNLPCSDAR